MMMEKKPTVTTILVKKIDAIAPVWEQLGVTCFHRLHDISISRPTRHPQVAHWQLPTFLVRRRPGRKAQTNVY
jgi:hypothetical protein